MPTRTSIAPSTASLTNAPRGLWTWRQALAARSFKNVRVVCVGSSTTEGLFASTTDRRYTEQLGAALRARLGMAGGRHWRALDATIGTSGTVTTVQRGLGLRSRQLAAGATLTTAATFCSGWTVLYEQGTGSGAFTYAVSGGGATGTITPDTVNTQLRSDGAFYIPNPGGSRTLTLTATTATVVNGVYVHNGDETSGVQVYNGGCAGTGASAWTGSGAAYITHLSRVTALAPKLVIIMIGSNDNGSVGPQVYKANVLQQVLTTRAACPGPVSVLLVHSYGRLDVNNPARPWSAYGAALADIASQVPDTAFLDISGHYPASQIGDLGDLLLADQIHQTDEGHAWMADLIADHLLGGLTGTSIPQRIGTAQVAADLWDPAVLPGLLAAWRSSSLGNSAQAALASWAPYAGEQTAALAQATASKQPSVTSDAFGIGTAVPAVRFTAAAAQVMQTAAWPQGYPVPLTVIVVARVKSTNYTLYSGTAGKFVYLGQSPNAGMMIMGAGAASEAQVYTGGQGWRVYATVFNGTQTRFLTNDLPMVTVTTGTSSAAQLDRFTLNGNSTQALNGDADYAEIAVYGRALSDTELASAVAFLARRYGLDGAGRATP